jgi:hypothetical protein
MENKDLIEAVVKLGQDSGAICICDDPTPAQLRTHFLSLLLYAAFFLAPFILG